MQSSNDLKSKRLKVKRVLVLRVRYHITPELYRGCLEQTRFPHHSVSFSWPRTTLVANVLIKPDRRRAAFGICDSSLPCTCALCLLSPMTYCVAASWPGGCLLCDPPDSAPSPRIARRGLRIGQFALALTSRHARTRKERRSSATLKVRDTSKWNHRAGGKTGEQRKILSVASYWYMYAPLALSKSHTRIVLIPGNPEDTPRRLAMPYPACPGCARQCPDQGPRPVTGINKRAHAECIHVYALTA